MLRMNRLFLVAVLLVGPAQSIYVDYCDIEPLACAFHTFDITGYNPNDIYICIIQPLQYNNSSQRFGPIGEMIQQDPTVLNDSAIECKLTDGLQSAEVTLEGLSEGIVGFAIIYPTLCFECKPDMSVCTLGYRDEFGFVRREKREAGCYIDSVCYPHYVVNPANFSEWCNIHPQGASLTSWMDITSVGNDPQDYYRRVDMCKAKEYERFQKFTSPNITMAAVPNGAGREGLDITAEGASYQLYLDERATIANNIKFFVKFDPEPITETETFFEIPLMLKMKRSPKDALLLEVAFLDAMANQVVITGEDDEDGEDSEGSGWTQLYGQASQKVLAKNNEDRIVIGMKIMINGRDVPKLVRNAWNLIGLEYDIYGGGTSLKLYLNGEEIVPDLGNTTGLYQRVSRPAVLSNGQFSCIEGRYFPGEGFFSDSNFTRCDSLVEPGDQCDGTCDLVEWSSPTGGTLPSDCHGIFRRTERICNESPTYQSTRTGGRQLVYTGSGWICAPTQVTMAPPCPTTDYMTLTGRNYYPTGSTSEIIGRCAMIGIE